MGLFSDNTTALVYLKKQVGIFSQSLNAETRLLLRWTETMGTTFAPIHYGGEECGGRLPEPLSSGSGVGIDTGSGGSRQVEEKVASDGRSFCHFSQFSSSSLLFPSQQPYGSGNRCLSPGLEQSSGLRFSSVCSHSPGSHQTVVLQAHRTDSDCPILDSERVVSGSFGSLGNFSCLHALQERSAQTAPLPSPAPESPCASSSCGKIFQRFARHIDLFKGVAHQLSLCRRSSSCRLFQHRWV